MIKYVDYSDNFNNFQSVNFKALKAGDYFFEPCLKEYYKVTEPNVGCYHYGVAVNVRTGKSSAFAPLEEVLLMKDKYF